MSELKAGDRIIFCKGKKNKCLADVTIGKIYTLSDSSRFLGDVKFIDDAEDCNYSASDDGDGKATKIID